MSGRANIEKAAYEELFVRRKSDPGRLIDVNVIDVKRG